MPFETFGMIFHEEFYGYSHYKQILGIGKVNFYLGNQLAISVQSF